MQNSPLKNKLRNQISTIEDQLLKKHLSNLETFYFEILKIEKVFLYLYKLTTTNESQNNSFDFFSSNDNGPKVCYYFSIFYNKDLVDKFDKVFEKIVFKRRFNEVFYDVEIIE